MGKAFNTIIKSLAEIVVGANTVEGTGDGSGALFIGTAGKNAGIVLIGWTTGAGGGACVVACWEFVPPGGIVEDDGIEVAVGCCIENGGVVQPVVVAGCTVALGGTFD